MTMTSPPNAAATTEAQRARNFVTLLDLNADRHAREPALSWDEDGLTRTYTWRQYRDAVLEVAAGLVDLGVAVGDRVGILASNRAEHLIADHAIRHCGAVPVSLYVTMSTEQAQHILSDCDPCVLIVEGEDAAALFSTVPWVAERRPTIVMLGAERVRGGGLTWSALRTRGAALLPGLRDEIADRTAGLELDDPATMIYTSGTTGLPKGVIVTHRNLLWDVDALVDAGLLDYPLSAVSYLPLAHITERVWSIYLAVRVAGHIYCCPEMSQLLPALQNQRPTFFMAVPRVWEKLATAAQMFMVSPALAGNAERLAADRTLVLDCWRRRVDGQAIDAQLSQADANARHGRLRAVRTFLGLERAQAASGAAALKVETLEFFASIGIRIVQGYGLTETSGPVFSELPDAAPSRGAVGVPLPGCEVRIADDGEILIRCPGNTAGYHHLPEATAGLIDADGWLRTGDVGRLDDAGRLHITDRKKEIIVTAAGKNVAPQSVENLLSGKSFIGQVVAVGEARPYIAALIAPDADLLRHFADKRGLRSVSLDDLVDHPDVVAEVERQVDTANSALSRPEQIKTWKLLPSGFSIEDGTLTPTFKIKRRTVHERYAGDIEDLYQR